MKILEKDFLGSATIGSSNGKEVLAYRRSLDDLISIMVVDDEPFSEEEAWVVHLMFILIMTKLNL
jgi:hypothetical protein